MEYINTPQAKFEERVKNLLKLLGFERIDGGTDCKIGNNQIDVYGKCEGKMVIVECTTQRKNLRSKLEEFKGKTHTIRRGIDALKHFRDLNKKNKLAFVFASKYSEILNYKSIADHEPKVFLLDINKIAYYEKISKAIPWRSKFDFLTEIGFTIDNSEAIKVPAFKIQYNEYEMYNFFISPDDLIKISYVARRESQGKDYYQRMIEISRLKNITKYLDKGGIFPTNIVVAINNSISFKKINFVENGLNLFPDWISVGLLELPKQYNGCWIIDGQHRLFSFTKKGMPQKLSVLAFNKISVNKQTEFFISINKNAKPINSNLLWDLEGDLRPNSGEGIISNIVKQLNLEEPFYRKIAIPSLGRGGNNSISMSAFCTAIQRSHFVGEHIKVGLGKFILKNPYFNKDFNKLTENLRIAIAYYFRTICEYISPSKEYLKNFIIDNSGMNVFMDLFKIFISIIQKKINENDIEKYVFPLIDYLEKKESPEIAQFIRRSTNNAGRIDMVKELLHQLINIDPKIIDYIEEDTDLKDKLIELEGHIRKIILIGLKNKQIEFSRLQQLFINLIHDIETNIHRNLTNTNELCEELTLGQSRDFLLKFWKDIYSTYFIRNQTINSFKEQFPSEEIFKAKLELAISTRNKLIHKKVIDLNQDDELEISKFTTRIAHILEYFSTPNKN